MTTDDAFHVWYRGCHRGNAAIIEVRVEELQHLFHTIDPTPFRERDLDPNVEEFIVDWSRELPTKRPLAHATGQRFRSLPIMIDQLR